MKNFFKILLGVTALLSVACSNTEIVKNKEVTTIEYKTEADIFLESDVNEYMKDPSVTELGGNKYLAVYEDLGKNRDVLILPFSYKIENGKRIFKKSEPVRLKIENREKDKDFVKWSPQLVLNETETGIDAYLYYTKGIQKPNVGAPTFGIEWKTFRIYVSKATLKKNIPIVEQLKTVEFKDEVKLFDFPEFKNPRDNNITKRNYGIIDVDVFKNKLGELYAYYTVVLNGIPYVRYHEEFIRVRKLNSYTDGNKTEDKEVYNGFIRYPHDGIAEASRTFEVDDKYLMLISSRPTDKDQIIFGIVDDNPEFVNSKNTYEEPDKNMISFYKGEGKKWEKTGVGHPDIFKVKDENGENKYFMLYQGRNYSGEYKFGILDVTNRIEKLKNTQN